MFTSIATLGFFSLIGFSCAMPKHLEPTSISSRGERSHVRSGRSGATTILATIMQTLSESDPNDSFDFITNNDELFHDIYISQSVDSQGQKSDRWNLFVAFENIPAGANTCQLAVTFPDGWDSYISSNGNPQLSVHTVDNGVSESMICPDDYTWSAFYPETSPPFGSGVFGTVTLTSGTTAVINSEACPVGGGRLAFIFSIAAEVSTTSSVFTYQFQQGAEFEAGFYLTYNP